MRRIGQVLWFIAKSPPLYFAILAGIYGLMEDDRAASAVYFAVIATSFLAIWVVQELRPVRPLADVFAAAVTRAEREPSAENRKAAAAIRDLFMSFKNEGFTDRQALEMVERMMAGKNPKDGD